MGTELGLFVAVAEVRRATSAFWEDSAEPDAETGSIRRAAVSFRRSLGRAINWLRGAQRTDAQTGTATGGA